MIKLTAKHMRRFRRAQRKYNVSIEFLKSNMAKIREFMLYAVSPHLVVKIQAMRKRSRSGCGQRVVLDYHHLRRFLFDPARRKMIKKRKRNVQQWSKRMVYHLKSKLGYQEYVEEEEEIEHLGETPTLPAMAPEEVSKELKKQLELLRSGKRNAKLIDDSGPDDSDAAPNNSADFDCQMQEVLDIQLVNKDLPQALNPTEKPNVNVVQDQENPVRKSREQQVNFHSAASEMCENPVEEEICEKTPEKQIVAAPTQDFLENMLQQQKTSYTKDIDEKTEEGDRDAHCDPLSMIELKDNGNALTADPTHKRTSGSFLDMLMSKVRVRKVSIDEAAEEEKNKCSHSDAVTAQQNCNVQHKDDHPQNCRQSEAAELTDSSEDFLGFEETDRPPGMLLTPLVPFSRKNTTNSAFVSELLNNYMRDNLLESSESKDETQDGFRRIHRQANFDGLVTPTSSPPIMSMPAIPESLQRLRTVAERRQFLHKFSKNHKLAIINNEATIYRELQRKMRQQKVKSAPLQMLQAPGANMSFTRQGWQAASFVVTDYNKYYYQMLQADGSSELIKLPGVRGNNEEKLKKPHFSRLPKNLKKDLHNCPDNCCDVLGWRDFKTIKTQAHKAKLHKNPFRPVLPPCPLSQKPFQKPLDDETAALLLAGGSMAVVRMPTVELEVFPKIARPLHEVAKRYLQYILPHHDISREWAEFSVSTLQHQLPRTMKEAEQAAAAANAAAGDGRRKSFTFAIPYLNDRNHILVRRVVDRSEQLDRSFEESRDASNTMAEMSFRAGLDPTDTLLQECADVVSDMITSVAISCSENSFIKDDPHSTYSASMQNMEKVTKTGKDLKAVPNEKTGDARGSVLSMPQQNRKQHRLLLELRRLNATIIEAGTKHEKEPKPCFEEHCALGCICSSLADDYPMRQHCGKSKCVIECNCKIPNNSHIMRLETDGRSITTEDAFLLRRKATARLARMEKEFTSTIVLTGNETLLINESQYDKKRRCTKAPKRYDDFTDADEDFQSSTGNSSTQTNSGAMVSLEKNNNDELTSTHSNSAFTESTTELREPIYIKDTVLSELKHCSVNLVPLQDMKNVAAWCMVHELYKCFCGGRAIEGKPIVIEKEEVNETIDATKVGDADYVATAPKARYSFEKIEQEVTSNSGKRSVENENEDSSDSVRLITNKNNEIEQPNNENNKEVTSANEDEHEDDDDDDDDNDGDKYGSNHKPNAFSKPTVYKRGRPHKIERRGRPLEITILNEYNNAKLNWCRRVVAIPMKIYTRRNRRRRDEVQEYIKSNENTKTQLLLNEHILRSVYYHKHELEKTLKAADKEKQQQVKVEKGAMPSPTKREVIEKSVSASKPLSTRPTQTQDVQIVDNDVEIVNESSTQSLATSAQTKSQRRRERRKRLRDEMLAAKNDGTQNEVGQPTDNSKKPRFNNDVTSSDNSGLPSSALTQESSQNSNASIQMPKISNCYSLNHQAIKSNDVSTTTSTAAVPVLPAPPPLQNHSTHTNQLPTSPDIGGATQGAEGQTAADLGLIEGAVSTDNFKEFYNVVIKNMNNLVSKKMQDIDMALKRESKVIPPPNEEILCIIKWSNFLDAFIEGYVFIWEVQMSDPQQPTFFAATITNLMPMIFGAVGVVNIAALQGKQLPLIGRMLIEKCRSEQTRKLAIVMQGRSKYWLVKGFLHPDSSKACAKPTPQTHPILTRKINVLCSLLVKQRVKEHQRKLELHQQEQQQQQQQQQETQQKQNIVFASSSQNLQIQIAQPEYLQNRPVVARRIVPKTTCGTHPSSVTPEPAKALKPGQKHSSLNEKSIVSTSTASQRAVQNKQQVVTSNLLRNLAAREEFLVMKSNIEFRKVTLLDIEEIQVPQIHQDDHRWLVLYLCNDFSHIFVPDFRDLVSLDRIQKVMAFSRQRKKNVKLQFFQNAPYDAFVTPSSKRNIYFGPLKFNMRPPLLILLQSVDGQMMLREVFQQQHQIQTAGKEQTTAFWILQINGKLHYQIDGDPNTDCSQKESQLQQQQQQLELGLKNAEHTELNRELEPENHNEDSDEDCVIVEDDHSNRKSNDGAEEIGELVETQQQKQQQQQQLMQPEKYCSIVTNPNSHGIPLLPQALPQAISLDSPPSTGEDPTSPMRMNFTIQAVESNSQLQIISDSGNALTTAQVPEPMIAPGGAIIPIPGNLGNNVTNPQQLPGFVPLSVVITNVATAPKEAPYGSTIYVSNMPAALNTDEAAKQSVGHDTTSQVTQTQNNFLKPIQESNSTPQQEVCTNSTETSTEDTLACKPAPIKRRRMSVRCPPSADIESRNIAIDAAKKLLDPGKNICFEELEVPQQEKITKLIKQSSLAESEIFTSPALETVAPTPTTMLLHNTTITKITDATSSTLNNKAKNLLPTSASKLGSADCTKKFRYLLPKTVSDESKKVTESSVVTTAAPSAPIVFDVSFDNAEEPAASIVIKPTTAGSTPVQPTSAVNTLVNQPTSVITPKANPVMNTLYKNCTVSPISVKNRSSVLQAQLSSIKSTTTSANTLNSTVVPRVKTANNIASRTSAIRVETKPVAAKGNSTVKNFPTYNIKKHVTLPQNVSSSIQVNNSNDPTAINTNFAKDHNTKISLADHQNIVVTASVSNSVQHKARLSLPNVSSSNTATTGWDQSPKKIAKLTTGFAPQRRSLPGQDKNPTNVNASNTSVMSTGIKGATASTSTIGNEAALDVQYGYFTANVAGFPKFVVKRVNNDYLIRVPNCQGILKVSGMANVNQYLNRHLLKSNNASEICGKLPAVWKFIPQDRLNPTTRRSKESINGDNKGSSNSTVITHNAKMRKLAAPPSQTITSNSSSVVMTSMIPTKTVTKLNQTHKVVPSEAVSAANQDKYDTILIED